MRRLESIYSQPLSQGTEQPDRPGYIQSLQEGNPERLAPTLQLLGSLDDYVASEDSIDLTAGAEFVYLRVRCTGHLSILDFRDQQLGGHRKEMIQAAIGRDIDALRDPANPPRKINPSDHIVFIMHGIRDLGLWTAQVRNAVQKLALATKQEVRVERSGYGYFPMLPFLLWQERQKNVRWFMDLYTEALARHAGPGTKIHFIGHSNSTYLAASALTLYRTCRFDHVAFAGSVVRRDFPWRRLIEQ
ncbi:MAG: hypothetical protein ACLQGP_04900 [Isosphaeraceae bacterium]